jgi:hypothetical protein
MYKNELTMTLKEQLIQAIEHAPDWVLQDLLQTLQQNALESSQPPKTVLERMGGVPKYLLSDGNLSDRYRRRALISDHLKQKYRQNS